MPWAARRLRIPAVDLVLSTHHAFAKNARLAPGQAHLCYCFTPLRYAWDQLDAYLGRGLRRGLAAPAVAALRRIDAAASGPDQVTRFVACSRAVADRIRRHYRRSARVVHPPVDLERFRPSTGPGDDFYLMVGTFVPYKRPEIAIEAFRRLERRLIVVGDGPARSRLARTAPANVEFTGRIDDAELADLYARCRALIHPQEEDFGICAVEAQAAGRPVVAFGRGGVRDTVRPLRETGPEDATGILFERQHPDDLVHAVERFEKHEPHFSARRIRRHAEAFGHERFARELDREIRATLARAADGAEPGAPAPCP